MDQQPQDIPGVGPALGGSGACPRIVCGDKTWTVGWPTQKAKSALEIATLELAVANHEEACAHLPAKFVARKQKELDGAIDGGHWRTWGELWTSVNEGPDGNTLFLLSLLREHHPDATLADARKLWREKGGETVRAFAVVVPSFFELLVADRPEPPAVKAALVKQGTEDVLRAIGALPNPTEQTSTS